MAQPSLQDFGYLRRNPTLERVGYSQIFPPGDGGLHLPEGDGSIDLPRGESIIAQQFTAGLDSRLHKSRRDG